jgi:hypothetical protein
MIDLTETARYASTPAVGSDELRHARCGYELRAGRCVSTERRLGERSCLC